MVLKHHTRDHLSLLIHALLFLFCLMVSPTQKALAVEKVKYQTNTEIEAYLAQTLAVEDISRFLPHLKLKKQIEAGLKLTGQSGFDSDGKINALGIAALDSKFYPQSKVILKKLIKSLGRSEYPNSILAGPAGSGKTFVTHQLVAILGLGVIPEFMNDFLSPTTPAPFIETLKSSFLEKTQFVSVDYDLLSRDNTRSGQAYAKAEVRMKSLLIDLFESAKTDFKKKGIRTIFILEEVATLPDFVQPTLKTLLDETGFKAASKDPIELGSEIGISVIGITTPWEYREMVGGDSAIERRYEYVYILEPTEAEALEILKKKKQSWYDRYGLEIDDHVLAYVISMRSFFSNPPLAMPHSVLKVMDGLFLWAMERSKREFENKVSMQDAYRYLIEQSHLPVEAWIPQNGKPPLYDLEERVQKHVIGHEKEIKHIVRRIKAGRTNGFSGFPVFIIMGPSGAGKDTLAKAINIELFGNSGAHLNFDVGGPRSRGLAPLLEGSQDELPELLSALNEGRPNGVIVLNEAKGLASQEFDRLKVLVETGIIHPKGKDSRARPLGLNILFIMGQYGEELLEGKSDQEIEKIINNLTEADLIQILQKGDKNGKNGAIPYALIQRAIKSGGLFFLKPTPQSKYLEIAELTVKSIIALLKIKSQISLTVDESVLKYVSDLAILNKRGTRGLDELLSTFTEVAISEAYDLGLPERGIDVLIAVEAQSEKILVQHMNGSQHIKTYEFKPNELLTSRCENLLGSL